MLSESKIQIYPQTRQSLAVIEEPIKVPEKPIGCGWNCTCQKCAINNFTVNVVIEDLNVQMVRGPIMIRKFVSNHHLMIGDAVITFRSIWKYDIKEITKLKCSCIDVLPGLAHLYVNLNIQEHHQEINVNYDQISQWFTKSIIAKLFMINRFGIPYRKFEGKIIGPVYVRSFLQGWKLINIQITDRLRMQKGKQVRIIRQLWTRFDLIDMNGPCLIVKFWDGIIKIQMALPFSMLSLWLTALTSILKAD